VGDAATGHIMDTYFGYELTAQERREQPWAGLWERATFVSVLENVHQATGERDLQRRIAADWTYVKGQYRPDQLEGAGARSLNPACDDAGWSANWYLNIYRA